MEKKSKIRKILPWIIGLAVVAGIAFYWNYQRTLAAQTPEYIKYTLRQRDPLVLKGTAQVTEYTSIPPKLAKGDVDVITVKSGQKVKIGDTLFTYKNKQSEDSITDARRQLDKTEQAVVDAKDDLAQAKKDQTSDKSSLDKANSNLTSSRSRLRTAQKDLTQAQTDRDKDKIETLNDKIAKESDNVQKYSQDVSRYQAKVDSWKSQIKQLEKAVTQSQTAETDAKFLLERIVSNQDLKEVADIDGVVKVNEENKTNPSGSLVDILSEVSEIKASVTEYDYFRIHPNQTGQAGKVPHAGILPHDLIQTAKPEHDHINNQHIRQHGSHGTDYFGPQHRGGHNGILTVKPQQNCQIITKHNQPAVQQH